MSDVDVPEELEEHKILVSRILRERLKNDRSDLNAFEEAGLIDYETYKYLRMFKKHKPDRYRKDERYKQVLEDAITQNIGKAIEEGNINRLGHAVGMGGNREKTDYRRIQRFKNILSREGQIYQISGKPNAGKTNLALFMAELWKETHNGSVASNMSSVKEFKTIEDYETFKEWLEGDGERFFIADDFSNHASGYASDRNAVETKMRKLTNFIAKNKASIGFIGHTGVDIHADIRRKSLFLDKKNQKHVGVYKNVKNGEGVGKILEINSVPESRYSYDPYEKTRWDWCIESDEENVEDVKGRIKEKLDELSRSKSKIQRSVDLPEFKTTEAKKVMRGWAENREKWRFRTSPDRLEKKRL